MKTEQQLTERFLEMHEHPERITEEELQQFLSDPQMSDLVEEVTFAKRTFATHEQQGQEPCVEEEWRKFAARHFPDTHAEEKPSVFTAFRLHKIAATFIGLFLAIGLTFATIHIVRQRNAQKPQIVEAEQQKTDNPAMPLVAADTASTDEADTVQTVVFDNVRLDDLLQQIAGHYRSDLVFARDTVRTLRFHFVWKKGKGLGEVIKKLNRFESLDIRLEDNIIIVE